MRVMFGLVLMSTLALSHGVPGKPAFGLLGWSHGVPGKPAFGLLGWPQNEFRQEPPGTDRIQGIIGDSACGLSHTVAPGLGAAGCTRYCVVRGAHYILIVGQKIYQLTGDPKLLDEFAGVPRTMIGHREGDTFHVTAIATE